MGGAPKTSGGFILPTQPESSDKDDVEIVGVIPAQPKKMPSYEESYSSQPSSEDSSGDELLGAKYCPPKNETNYLSLFSFFRLSLS